MKKMLAFLLAVTTCFCSFTACGKGDDDDDNEKKSSSGKSSMSDTVSDKDDEDKSDKEDDPEEGDKDKDKKDGDDTDKMNGEDKDNSANGNDKNTIVDKDSEEKTSGSDGEATTTDDKKDNDGKNDKDADKDTLDVFNGELGEKRKPTKDEKNNYKKVIVNTVETVGEGGAKELIKSGMPDKVYASMSKVGLLESLTSGISSEDMALPEDLDSDNVEVTAVRDLDKESMDMIETMYSALDQLCTGLADAGVTADMIIGKEEMPEDLDEKKLEELENLMSAFDDMGSSNDIKKTVEFEEYKLVTFEKNGEDIELPVFKVKGEDYKMDLVIYPAMIGYVKKSKLSSAVVAASSISKAYSAAVCDIETEGCDVNGVYIISSDSSRNILASEEKETLGGELDKLDKLVKEYYNDIDKVDDYFIVIENGECRYAVVKKDYVGAYPANSYVKLYDEQKGLEFENDMDGFKKGKYSIDELYDFCKKAMEN